MLNNSLKHVTLSQNHMATTFVFRISLPERDAPRAEACLAQCHTLVDDLENTLSEFKPESPLFKLNGAVPFEPISMASEALELLNLSRSLEMSTRGAFSAAAKGLGKFDESVRYSLTERTAQRLSQDSILSFGAIGKGFALDRVRTQIESWGFQDYLLSAGGSSLVVSGFSALSSPWQIGWSPNGKDSKVLLSHRSGLPIALGISGLSEQGMHILDPRAKAPIAPVKSALVSHPSAAYADALSTALFVLGWEEGLATFQTLVQKPSLALLDSNDEFHWNGTFQKHWGQLQ